MFKLFKPSQGHLLWCLLSVSLSTQAQMAQPLEAFNLPNLDIDPQNISGIVLQPDFMGLVTDEGTALQILQKKGNSWSPMKPLTLSNKPEEIDLEGLAFQEPYLYAIGSHSAKRPRTKDGASDEKNLKRLTQVLPEISRQQVFRISLDSQQNAQKIESLSVQPLIEEHPILGRFVPIPSKENGIDIEGLSTDSEGRLLVGFRGPVIRGNLAPVLRLTLKKKRFEVKKVDTFWLNLNGRGIRGLSQVGKQDQWLILSGDVGDLETAYQVTLWEGQTQINAMQPLCDLPKSQGKPEGIAFVGKQGKQWQFVIVQDGLKNGGAQLFSCLEK